MGEFKPKELINEIVQKFSSGHSFEKMIKPIILYPEKNGNFDEIEILNRLAYTIVDQQRDVESIIIPIWSTLMLMNMTPEFFEKSPHAREFVKSIFKAYGHQQYHTKKDLGIMNKRLASRTDAFIELYQTYTPQDFLDFMGKNRNNTKFIFSELIKLKFISMKSAAFFLRDISGLEFNILPVDVNVAYAIQYTGLFFIDEIFKIEENFSDLLKRAIPVQKRTKIENYHKISNKIKEICDSAANLPKSNELNRYLFILGANYCQNLHCTSCPVNRGCYYNCIMQDGEKKLFREKIKEKKNTKKKKKGIS